MPQVEKVDNLISKTLLAQVGYEETVNRRCGNCMYFRPQTAMKTSACGNFRQMNPNYCGLLSFARLGQTEPSYTIVNPKKGRCRSHTTGPKIKDYTNDN